MSILGGSTGFIEGGYDALVLMFANEDVAEGGLGSALQNEFADIFAIRGLSAGIPLTADPDQREGQSPKWRHLLAHGFSGDIPNMRNTITSHVTGGDAGVWFCEAIASVEQKPYAENDKDEHIFMALTDPKPGREDDYHEWYDRHHVKDVVSVDCYRSGRRFRITASCGGYAPWGYLAFYRFVGETPKMHQSLEDDMRRGETVMTDAYEAGDGAWIYGAR
jgi:hypothetical protein